MKLALLAFEVSFISNWVGAQIKFTWGFVKVYLSLTSDSNEAQLDFFHVLLMKRKRIRIYTSYKSKKQCSVSVVIKFAENHDEAIHLQIRRA